MAGRVSPSGPPRGLGKESFQAVDPLTLLLPVIIVVVFYFLIIKPGKARQRQAMETQNSLVPGAEVRTIAGLYATVTEVEDDSVILEVAPDVHCRFVKSAIAAVLSSGDEPEDDETDDEHDDAAETGDDAVRLDKKPEAGEDADAADGKTVDVTKAEGASKASETGDRLRKDDKQD
ncbi:preprotein translocase subunit YajC [Embleya hyalina]|uniref:Preprotein translocase subunit YajC n=1 Tax=Embleya hyalina TaxID=516124 RepID=A0A401Z4G0_9ACTN|nr:preprotein translocase subunit YajC [Embleya hyalina]